METGSKDNYTTLLFFTKKETIGENIITLLDAYFK
jgi:hypothetical protein